MTLSAMSHAELPAYKPDCQPRVSARRMDGSERRTGIGINRLGNAVDKLSQLFSQIEPTVKTTRKSSTVKGQVVGQLFVRTRLRLFR